MSKKIVLQPIALAADASHDGSEELISMTQNL
jgi:hypothetical protein